jgi:acyl carrier protein
MVTGQSSTELNGSEIAGLVLASLKDVLATSDDGVSDDAQLGEDTRLIGRAGVLDSMGLVTLIVDVEQRLEEEYDTVVVLADERALSQTRSPFRSVGSLADYICQLVKEEA